MFDAIRRLAIWPTTTRRKSFHPVTSHHGVSIRPGRHACERARTLSGKRFLARHAPKLPLEGCNTGDCACRYRHYEDRRQRPRRSADLGIDGHLYSAEDRRTTAERRRTKRARAQSYFDYSAGD